MSWTMRKRRRVRGNIRSQFDFCSIQTVYLPTGDLIQNDHYDSDPHISSLQIQETEDVDRKVHPRNKLSKDDGGPFFSRKLDIVIDPIPCGLNHVDNNGTYKSTYRYEGTAQLITPLTLGLTFADSATLNQMFSGITFPAQDLSYWGPQAFARMDPTRDSRIPDLARSIAELVREGLPHLPLKLFPKLKKLRSLGSEYLNVTFGWKPLLNDIDQMIELYRKIDDILKQLRRDNGQSVRRSGTLFYDKSVSDRSTIQGECTAYVPRYFPILSNVGDGPPNGPFDTWTETETRVWFSGKGSYILNENLLYDQSNSKIDAYAKILKANLSPSTVYELLPWSWLINWFSNIGSIVENAIGHGVGTYTADYCYLMRTVRKTTYYDCLNFNRRGFFTGAGVKYPTTVRDAQIKVIETTKERIAASPFGFGLTLPDLSAEQWAILTALGLSRQNFI